MRQRNGHRFFPRVIPGDFLGQPCCKQLTVVHSLLRSTRVLATTSNSVNENSCRKSEGHQIVKEFSTNECSKHFLSHLNAHEREIPHPIVALRQITLAVTIPLLCSIEILTQIKRIFKLWNCFWAGQVLATYPYEHRKYEDSLDPRYLYQQ